MAKWAIRMDGLFLYVVKNLLSLCDVNIGKMTIFVGNF